MDKIAIRFIPAILAVIVSLPANVGQAQERPSSSAPFGDEPSAHALYDKMIKTMRDARSLSYASDYLWEDGGREVGHAIYRIWLKKPNQFRLEASRFGSDGLSGVLVGDGDYLWIYWPNGKVRYLYEYSGEYAQQYEKYRFTSYMKERTPPARHSIAHQTGRLGAGMGMTILDPSTFHGYTDSLQAYVDGVRHLGTETVGGEECDVIEVSIMKHQRSWHLWLSRKDHLPRKLKQVLRVSSEQVVHEIWSDVVINGEIPADKFAWSPPADWREWMIPSES
jgi:outer membrane lipoprotein-sorting protein